MVPLLAPLLAVFGLSIIYLWHASRSISTAPDDAVKLTQKPFTKQQIEEAYRLAQATPVDVKPYLFSKKNRRYVVTGGSGMHRGEALPSHTDICRTCGWLDCAAPTDAR